MFGSSVVLVGYWQISQSSSTKDAVERQNVLQIINDKRHETFYTAA